MKLIFFWQSTEGILIFKYVLIEIKLQNKITVFFFFGEKLWGEIKMRKVKKKYKKGHIR